MNTLGSETLKEFGVDKSKELADINSISIVWRRIFKDVFWLLASFFGRCIAYRPLLSQIRSCKLAHKLD